MPAVSKSQQALMGQAYAVKTGKLKPEDIDPEYREQIVTLAKDMKEDDLKDYAETKHEGLPKRKHVKEYYIWWDDQVSQKSGLYMANKRDQTDPLVQSFMNFIEGKSKKVKEVDEDFSAPAASVTNTPGMGNAVPATINSVGSGDTFSATGSRKKKKHKTNDYKEWLKIKAAPNGKEN
jgi:hypothetical protein